MQESGNKGNRNHVAVAKEGDHNVSRNQEGSQSEKRQIAETAQGGTAGSGPDTNGIVQSKSDALGNEAVCKDAVKPHPNAAQTAETGSAQHETPKVDAVAGKKKHHKGKKKKKNK